MKPLILALSIVCASDCAAQAFSREQLIAAYNLQVKLKFPNSIDELFKRVWAEP